MLIGVNRRGKIVCTLGPATATDEAVRALVEAGMDVARLNFSHGDYADHEANYKRVRAASDVTGRAVGILADLQGPKIRLGRFADGPDLLGQRRDRPHHRRRLRRHPRPGVDHLQAAGRGRHAR